MSKLADSQSILKTLGLPPEQQSEAAGYTLLALAGLRERDAWAKANQSLLRIHDILQFIKNEYGKSYAENTRETIRRRVLHQFDQARIVDRNPDQPSRATNSGKTCYALTQQAIAVIASFGTNRFLELAAEFQQNHPALLEMYRAARNNLAVQVDLPDGVKALLSPGRHNELQSVVIKEFWPRFIPGAKLLYVGDTAKKDWHVETRMLDKVRLPYSLHDKFPDIVFWLEETQWLVLVEAVTTHGPCSPKRRSELEALLSGSDCRRIYVTAFQTWKEFRQHMKVIAWDTEVWLAEVPDHMIHYNGPKFLR